MGDVWDAIRADYARRFAELKQQGATQQEVARLGGIAEGAGQNSLSRLLKNDKLGPSVEMFVRALLGLRVAPSEFFAGIEHQFPQPDVEPSWAPSAPISGRDRGRHTNVPPDDPDRQLALEIGRSIIRACRRGYASPPATPGPERHKRRR